MGQLEKTARSLAAEQGVLRLWILNLDLGTPCEGDLEFYEELKCVK